MNSSLALLLTVALAAWLLGERPTAWALVGILIVIVGVFLLAGGSALLRSRYARVRAGLVWGVGTGLFIALSSIVAARPAWIASVAAPAASRRRSAWSCSPYMA